MITNKYAVVCNPVIEKDGEEIAGPLITVNPAGVAVAEACTWKNNSAVNHGTMLHFINPNMKPLKVAASLDIWHVWIQGSLL